MGRTEVVPTEVLLPKNWQVPRLPQGRGTCRSVSMYLPAQADARAAPPTGPRVINCQA
jgi:hypothetical protein